MLASYGHNMSRQRSLKELFPNSRSVPEEQDDNDLGALVPEEEESDDNLGDSLSIDTAAVVPD